MRIVTLLPSATEIVCLLGRRNDLVGVSHECDFPADVCSLPKVTAALLPAGATSGEIDAQVRQHLEDKLPLYSLDVDLLESLRPDVVITQDLCSVCAVSTNDLQRAARQLPAATTFLTLEPTTLKGVLQSIADVAKVLDSEAEAVRQLAMLHARIDAVRRRTQDQQFLSAVFLEWLDPPFSAGHWVPELVHLAGARELIGRPGEKSRTISWADIAAADPDVLIAACCGYSAKQTQQDIARLAEKPDWQSLRAVQNNHVLVLDGNAYFSRPGPRLVEGLEILAAALE